MNIITKLIPILVLILLFLFTNGFFSSTTTVTNSVQNEITTTTTAAVLSTITTSSSPKISKLDETEKANDVIVHVHHRKTFFHVDSWKQLSISNPNERFYHSSSQNFEKYFDQQRKFFFSSSTNREQRNNNDDENIENIFQLVSSSSTDGSKKSINTSSSYCSIPSGKSVSARERKYNMQAELCWAPVRVNNNKLPSSGKHQQQHQQGCLGVVKISPKSTEHSKNYCQSASSSIPVSQNKLWAELLKQTIGPLHLRLLLEGPEVVSASIFFDADACEYWLHFFVASPGLYGLNFKVVHDDFWGVDETSHRTKHNLGAYWFSRSMPMLKCEFVVEKDQQQQARQHREENSQKSQNNLLPKEERWVQRLSGVPKFAGRYLIQNTLQRIPYFVDYETTKIVVHGIDPRAVPPFGVAKLATKENLKFQQKLSLPLPEKKEETSTTADYFPIEKWLSAEELTNPEKCSTLLSSRRQKRHKTDKRAYSWIFVLGDSQSRSITWSLKNYLQTAAAAEFNSTKNITDREDSYNLRDDQGKKISQSSDFFLNGKWKISFSWDSYLDVLSGFDTIPENSKDYVKESKEAKLLKKESLEKADVIVAGLGHHPASWGQWTFEEYFMKSKKIAEKLCSIVDDDDHNDNNKLVFWYGAPAWPKPKLVDNFRGTNQRLAIFNGLMLGHLENECVKNRGVELEILVSTSTSLEHQRRKRSNNNNNNKTKKLFLMDFFGITSPVMKHSKDGSHYDGTVVAAACADKLFKKLCEG